MTEMSLYLVMAALYNYEKISSYTRKGYRLQLVIQIDSYYRRMYQVRENRKVIISTVFEYNARKEFVKRVQADCLQLSLC